MAGIVSYGAYIPYYRLPRSVINKAWGRSGGRGERAVANYDEDPTSMAVAAGMDCLKGFNPKTVEAFYLATTSASYKERQNATIAATALDIPEHGTRQADITDTLRVSTIAFLSALDSVKAGSVKTAMIAAADIRLGGASGENEQAFGDGAGALLLGNDNLIAEVLGSYTISADFVDNWRISDDIFVRSWEERFGLDEGYRKIPVEAATALLKKLNLAPKDFAKVCFPGPNSRRHAELGAALGFKPEQIQESLLDTVGNTGAALPLMVLAGALEDAKAGDKILLVSWGNGSDAIAMQVTPTIEKLRDRRAIKRHLNIKRVLDNYEKYLRWRGLVPLEAAARPEKAPTSMSSLWREHWTALPLYGAKCKKCGTAQMLLDFASTRPRVCLECHATDQFEPYRFADKRGKVASFSHDFLALSQDPPNTLTVVDFDGGGRGNFEMADRDPAECKVGMQVEMTFRKIYTSRGVHNYFWKCKPARD